MKATNLLFKLICEPVEGRQTIEDHNVKLVKQACKRNGYTLKASAGYLLRLWRQVIRVYVVENLIFLNALLDPSIVDSNPVQSINLADVLPDAGVKPIIEHHIVSFRVVRHNPTSIFNQHSPDLLNRLPFLRTRVALLDNCKRHPHKQVALNLVLNVATTSANLTILFYAI